MEIVHLATHLVKLAQIPLVNAKMDFSTLAQLQLNVLLVMPEMQNTDVH